jgi:hypothetical protein
MEERKEDYLTEDKLVSNEQKYVCLSFLSPSGKNNIYGVKVRGVFSTYEKACAHAKLLQETDAYHNIFVGEMGKWLPFDPNPTDNELVKDAEYQNEQLNSLMKEYLLNQEKAKVEFNKQKNENVMKNLMENLDVLQKNKDRLKEEFNNTQDQELKDRLFRELTTVEENISSKENKVNELNKSIAELEKELQKVNLKSK